MSLSVMWSAPRTSSRPRASDSAGCLGPGARPDSQGSEPRNSHEQELDT